MLFKCINFLLVYFYNDSTYNLKKIILKHISSPTQILTKFYSEAHSLLHKR